jgi:hypothetical protein
MATSIERSWSLRVILRTLLLASVTLSAANEAAQACSVCGGDPQSNMVQGALSGVVVMVFVTYGLLMGFVAMGVTWFVRARRIASKGEAVSENPTTGR